MVGERFHRLSYYYNNAVLYIVKDSMTEVRNTRNDIPDIIQTICDRDICFKKAHANKALIAFFFVPIFKSLNMAQI